MTDREKALEAALRRARPWMMQQVITTDVGLREFQAVRREVDAALAMPATVDRWEAGRDAAAGIADEHFNSAVQMLKDARLEAKVTGRWFDASLYNEEARNAARIRDAIRALTPPEDAT